MKSEIVAELQEVVAVQRRPFIQAWLYVSLQSKTINFYWIKQCSFLLLLLKNIKENLVRLKTYKVDPQKIIHYQVCQLSDQLEGFIWTSDKQSEVKIRFPSRDLDAVRRK